MWLVRMCFNWYKIGGDPWDEGNNDQRLVVKPFLPRRQIMDWQKSLSLTVNYSSYFMDCKSKLTIWIEPKQFINWLMTLSPDSHPSLTTHTISAYTYDHPKSQKRKSYHLLIVILSSPNTLAIINLTFSTSIVLFSQKTSSLQNTWSLFQFLLWNSVKKITEKVQSFRNTLWIFIKWVTAQFNNKCPCFLVSDWITTLISK